MLYSSKRSLLLLAGLPAVISFGTGPFMPKMDGDDLAVESSLAVQLAVLNYPDTICRKLGEVKILSDPNDWCATGRPTRENCLNGNRLRLGPSEDMGAKALTPLGEATIFDICAWDPDFKNTGVGKCVMSGFSYRCLSTCPGVENYPDPKGRLTGEKYKYTHIQTECLSKTRESVSQYYKAGGVFYPKVLTNVPATCEQKLVHCCSTQTWVTPWDEKICGKQQGTVKDGCCSNEDCPSSELIARGRRMEEDLEDDETKLKPRVGRRLSDVCPGSGLGAAGKFEMPNGGICCEGQLVLFPDANWFLANPGQRGYFKGDPRVVLNGEKRVQYNILEECDYKGGNTCDCRQFEEEAFGEADECPIAKPLLWDTGKGR